MGAPLDIVHENEMKKRDRKDLLKKVREKFKKKELKLLGQNVADFVNANNRSTLDTRSWGDILWEALFTGADTKDFSDLERCTLAPLEDVPLFLGYSSNHIRLIASWRLKIGR